KMVHSSKAPNRSLGQIPWDLIRISRYDKYNSFLSLFAGVWSTLLAGGTRLREDPSHVSVTFVLTRVLLCSLAAYIFSGAGMVWNDWVDRDIDARVARTKDRPLAAGRLHTAEAMVWMLLQAATATTFLYWMMDGQYVLHSMIPPTLGTLIYPYCKRPLARRIGIYPQYVLGLTASCPVLFGRASIYPDLDSFSALVRSSLPLCIVVFTWTLYFNTAYSYQDIVDDKKLGVNSLYTLAGQHIHRVLTALAIIVTGALCWTLCPLGSRWLWVSWLGVWIMGFVDQMRRFDAKNPGSGSYVFRSNVVMGLWTMVACLLEVVWRG
ncbi:4-hydroxybenzoate octaprenyltransferase, partial [Aspergillus homomorphus CBS 101889]